MKEIKLSKKETDYVKQNKKMEKQATILTFVVAGLMIIALIALGVVFFNTISRI